MRLDAELLYIPVLWRQARQFRFFLNEIDLDFRDQIRVILPFAIYLPSKDEFIRRIPSQNPAPVALRTVHADFGLSASSRILTDRPL
jgi:hypothetical protein